MNFIYRLSFCNDSADNGYGKAPFIYNGDGAISTYYGFRIGKDCYFPGNDMLTYMDVNSGRIISSQMSKLDNRHIQDYSITGRHKTYSGWEMFGSIHLCALYPTSSVRIAISGIDNAIVSSGYTKTNGDIFCGKIQNRFAEIDHVESYDLELLFRVEKQWNRHHLLLGTSLMYANQYQDASTAYFAHTVEPNPERIYKNGQESWNLNRSGQFFMGNRYSAAFFAIHDWNITNQFQARTGIRLTPAGFDIMSAAQMNGENINKRVEGFNISNPNLCSLHNIKKIGLDAAVSEHLSYGFAKGLFATADGFFSRVNKTTTYFKNQTIPSTKPIGYAFGSIGLKYEHSIIDCAAVVSYISSWNNAKLMSVSKQVSGHSETIPWTAEYGIGTLGCTVDANLHIRGFNLHALVTWQDPKYKNYYNEFVFSDNTRLVIDYSGKFVTGISRVIVEFDPSYSWKDYRIWASFRYYSRQYASRTNYAYFNGHIESFAGFDVSFNQRNKVSIRFVNILFQNGVKGSLDIADTIDDPGLLVNYLMAGSYIRPFTIELKYTFHF